MKKPLKNKLPRKRKKAFKKAHADKNTYKEYRFINQLAFNLGGTPCNFPKWEKRGENW